MDARRFFEEAHDLLEARKRFVASDEAAFGADEQSHDAEAAGTRSDDAIIAGNTFEGSAGIGMRAFPVITETSFLQHGEEFIVGHGARGGADGFGWRRITITAIDSNNSVGRLFADLAEKIRVTMDAGNLNANRNKRSSIERAFDAEVLEVVVRIGLPSDVNVALVAFCFRILWREKTGRIIALRGILR